jgi:glutamate/tyrosine decarboxylase-like PLP-dependent enzyme
MLVASMAQDVMRDTELLAEALDHLEGEFSALPGYTPEIPGEKRMAAVLAEAAHRLGDNFPYFHPLYAGQMLKPPHPVARAAYAMAMWLNPNNHALDGGRASSRMEWEAVREIAAMFGWSEFIGHLTGGGTLANLEALWVAGQMMPGKKIVASEQAHYTHQRITGVLRLPFASIVCDEQGRMDLPHLQAALASGEVGTVVATLGTTGSGAVDPLGPILDLREKFRFRLHVDAAYGGYFRLASNLCGDAANAFERITEADSIVVDPHKHGLQPYGCGCVLFRDPAMGRWYKHDSPCTYFTSQELHIHGGTQAAQPGASCAVGSFAAELFAEGSLHLGEISLECSRAGASAVALWTTQRLLPLVPGGEFANDLEKCREAALRLHSIIASDPRFVAGPAPDLDIVVWAMRAPTLAESSRRAQDVFDRAAKHDLHLALAQMPARLFPGAAWTGAGDGGVVTCLRSVLMKPEHFAWIDRISDRLRQAG